MKEWIDNFFSLFLLIWLVNEKGDEDDLVEKIS